MFRVLGFRAGIDRSVMLVYNDSGLLLGFRFNIGFRVLG